MVAIALAITATLGAVTVWALTTKDGSAPVATGSTLPMAESTAGAPAAGPTPTLTASPRTAAEGVASSAGKGQSVDQKGGGAKGVSGSDGSGGSSGGSTGSIGGSTGSSGASSTPKGPLAGPGCPSTEANKTDTFTPGDGWHSASGGWSGNGCNGTVEYSDLTGSATHWEDDFDWAFTVGKGARCRFTIYIPHTSRAGAAAAYDVYGPDQSATKYRIATFSIDQRTHRGTWVSSPSYTFPDGVAQVQLVDRGTPGNATVAASATVIACS
jgi:translation initiation factor IF-2